MGVLSQFDSVAPSPPRNRGGGSGGGGSGGLPAYPYRKRTSSRRETAIRSANFNPFSTFCFSLPFELNPQTTKPRATGSLGIIIPAVLNSEPKPEKSHSRHTNAYQRQPRTTQLWKSICSLPKKGEEHEEPFSTPRPRFIF